MTEMEEKEFIKSEEQKYNIKNICFSILETILEYSINSEKNPSSIFDNQSNVNNEYQILDEYNFEELFLFCVKILKINDNLLVLIMMYIDKILSSNNFSLNEKNINRLFYTCLMVTQKYYEDNSFNNKIYADLVGISCDELLNLEMEFMNLINFELFIKDDEFDKYNKKIMKFYL